MDERTETCKNNRTTVSVGIVIIVLLFTAFAMIAYSFFKSVRNELYIERKHNLNEVSEQIANSVNSVCGCSWDVADAAFSHLLSTEIENKNELSALLEEAEKGIYNLNYRLMVVDSKTNYYLSNERSGLFKNVELLRKFASERQVVITSGAFEYDKEDMLFLHRLDAPLILKDGTQITHTVMILPPEEYCAAFSFSGYDGYADIFIVHTDGRSIYRRSNIGEFSIAANIMRMFENVRFLHGESFENLKDSLENPLGESIEFEYEDNNYFVSMTPIKTPNWVVVLIVPTKEMNSDSELLLNVTMRRVIAMAVIGVLIVVIFIYYYISAANMRLQTAQQSRLNAALKKAAEESDRANLAKSEFLSHMSHDFRTPLYGILGMLERAEESPDITEELRFCLDNIRSASNHLNSLINDVLDMSRLESSADISAEKAFDLRKITDTCCSIIQSSANQHNINFTYKCNGFRHPYLIGCDLYLRKVLINVLGNAVKFTDEGGSVIFETEELSSDGDTTEFRFTVSDTGIGMSESSLEHIFEPFWQESNSRTYFEGTGLGMAIVKKLVDKMGGTINMYSKVNEGSRFTIALTFRINRAAPDVPEHLEKSISPSALDGMTVLLCDDNKLNLNIAERLLKKAGANVILAFGGEEAIEYFENSDVGSIDVILMDVMMPDTDGLEATKRIRSLCRPDAASVPIISMTANAFEEDVQKSLSAGMNGHFSKPINGKLLVSTVMKYKKNN